MKTKVANAVTVVIIAVAFSSIISVCKAEDYEISYQLLNKQDGTGACRLNMVVPQGLYEYYEEKSHRLVSNSDFAKFVTPYALKPMADTLWEFYEDDEDFVNGILMIVHQITYEETLPEKYPVQTMIDNKGDCDLFSFIAASIMKAGGFNVVLLHYEEQKHMNIGVHLSNPPKNARGSVCSVTYQDVTYYVAECTGGNWTTGWRVGECPSSLKQVSARVITLENAEEVAPGQVSAGFTVLEPSVISLDISPTIAIQTSAITLLGQLTPTKPNENVTIYVGVNGSPWTVLGTAITQSDGNFEFIWKTHTAGIYSIRASWPGDEAYAGAISLTKNATVIPLFLAVLIAVAVIATIIGAIAVFALRKKQPESPEPEEPQPPAL